MKNKVVKSLLVLSAICGVLSVKPTISMANPVSNIEGKVKEVIKTDIVTTESDEKDLDVKVKEVVKVEEKEEKKEEDKIKIAKGTVLYIGNDFLAIRKDATTNSKMIGKLTKNCGAVKTGGRKGSWVEVISGELKGWLYEPDTISGAELQKYVKENIDQLDIDVVTKNITGQYQTKKDLKDDVLLYSINGLLQKDSIKLYKTASLTNTRQDKVGYKDYVVITEDGTRIRNNPSIEDSLIYDLRYIGEEFEYIETVEDWYKIKYNDKEGYIRNDCAKKITKEVELNNVAKVDYIVNAMYEVETLEDGITRIKIKDKDYYVSTDDVYFMYLKDTKECTATNIVGSDLAYDLNSITKTTYKVDVTNPVSDTKISMYMPKEDCILSASFEEAEEINEVEEQKNNGKDSKYELNLIDIKTRSKYKNKYDYVWDNSSTDERNEIINYACQFLGNPYRYGGTSLTNGIDCSAFCMKILQHFGKSIGRDSNTQYKESRGRKIDAKDIQPGDLIYYSSNGGKTTYHVSMYLGDGKVINASCRRFGICISDINYGDICAIKNYID